MKLATRFRQPIETQLSRRSKQALLVVMVASIFVLLLALEQAGGAPFLYIGF